MTPREGGAARATSAGDRVAVALDGLDARGAMALVETLGEEARLFKVGPGLFLDAGPSIVSRIRERGARVFLDLKFHDIPNTVASAVARAADLGVALLTLHASGGREMLRAAREAARGEGSPRLLAVTLLTSLDAPAASEIYGEAGRDPGALALGLARVARDEGIDGLVCSPLEAAAMRASFGPGCLLVTPGIRSGAGSGPPRGDDQKRTRGAAEALRAGADVIVVGRPILDAPAPREAFLKILAEVGVARGAAAS